jgi:hypothetical protein
VQYTARTLAPSKRDQSKASKEEIMLNAIRDILPQILPEVVIAGMALFFPLAVFVSIIGS